ncbi:methyltransferase family protein [Leucobacter luti]|uniref:methyltransferase n=1 Tax=Leucobacter luti TaxID=340320 RepID=UPI00105037A3|nr:class I SAM-dependent methyltransferase [Leucobacter luti]MCW2289129.1 methylase of polypeptide subunit release factors [Leucobacter luti]TCK35474.1 methyltransferase family protein [Leucobacter luti]
MSSVSWIENGVTHSAQWHSENGTPAPTRIVVIGDETATNTALRLAKPSTALLWRGDFQNARNLMRAMDRRLQKRPDRTPPSSDLGALFRAHRKARADRATILGKILIALEPDYSIQLRRAPDVRDACAHAYGPHEAALPHRADESGTARSTGGSDPAPHLGDPSDTGAPSDTRTHSRTGDPGGGGGVTLVSLAELIGVLGAYQWHMTGIEVPALGARLIPAYGVFAPTRDEYLDLVAQAPFPAGAERPVVFDIGTGTGVLAAMLAQRGAASVIATDINQRAVACASENMRQLGLADQVEVVAADLWPESAQLADVIVCNPPWLPGTPTSDLELGIYDPSSDVLHRFLAGLAQRLTPGGEGWLILSDLAELLGLRSREELLTHISSAGLHVVGRLETAPRHSRAADAADPLHEARSRERTVLWRLAPQPA